MPVNSIPVTKVSVERSKYSLSLNRKHGSNVKNELVENSKTCPAATSKGDKENKPEKRKLNGTYFNTLQAAKKLKPLEESHVASEGSVLPVIKNKTKPAASRTALKTAANPVIKRGAKSDKSVTALCTSAVMLNGVHPGHSQYGARHTPVATLSNLGNTCFLNSVLYTLRYAPRFVHNLHHLVSDLASVEQKLGSMRLKSSSLGRTATLASSGARSWSTKDLLSLGQNDSSGKSKIQIATEKLHETYLNLRAAESKCLSASSETTPEPYAADAFLAALRDVNSTFEGNRQQDAHELLVCILDNIRETCRALSARAHLHLNGDSNGLTRQPSLDGDGGKSTHSLRKSWKKRKEGKDRRHSPERAPSPTLGGETERPGWDFVADDFEGTMVVRTTCVECETVTECAQAVCELGVPVADDAQLHPEEPFRAACLSTEYLKDQNKYWCERCLRYNEARRTVAYSRLPRLLVFQLKRFSGGMEKITRHAPTPLLMPCFCEPCVRRGPETPPLHKYILWAVIMHLGQTLTGGHYVAYARDSECTDYRCEREGNGDATPPNSGSSFIRSLFSRPRPQTTGCNAKECCVPRSRSESCWLACDDDQVKPISNEEFEDLLSAEPKMRTAATPYLLFYVKSEVG